MENKESLVKLDDLLSIPNQELTEQEFRLWISDLEESINLDFETHDRKTSISAGFSLEEAVTPGIYTRELTMTAGSLVFSKIHIQTHPFAILKGKVSVYDGESIQVIEAPFKSITKAGTKRVLYVHEDTVWITFHPVATDDLSKIDENGVITCDTFEEYDRLKIEVDL